MLEQKLEELKQAGNYSIQVSYGEGTGCDDLDTPQKERIVVITSYPVGYIGSLRLMWKGTLPELAVFNFALSIPTEISNPPKREEYENNGYYVWGTEGALKEYHTK